jgi:uncharacterized membrane-anchored protein YjiN (DUF445 family)
MSPIEKIIRENQDEFVNLVVKFVEEKTKVKKKKASKIICHFQALGKNYCSNIFAENYKEFLMDTSKILDYDKFQPILQSFITKNENEFSDSHRKSSIIKLHNKGLISSHSGSKVKLKHIKELCEVMGINFTIK